MAKKAYTSGRARSGSSAGLGRTEHPVDEDRPFAEIRKNLHDVLRMLSLHRWAFFVPFSVVTCTAFILSLYYPRTYSATTSFERRNDPVMMNLPMSAGAASFKYFRNTMVRDLTSIECTSEAVENLGLTKNFERNEDGSLTRASIRRRNALARSLAAKLSISTTSPSEHIDIIRITYTGPDPTIGKNLVDEVKRTYIRRTMAWIHEFLTSQRDYFRREAEEALEEVKRAQRDETRLRLENPHVDPADPGAISLTLAQLEMESRELLLRQREYKAELSALQQMLATIGPQSAYEPGMANQSDSLAEEGSVSPEVLQLSTQSREIDHQIERLRATRGMTDQHPEIQALLARRQWLEEELERHGIVRRGTAVTNGPLFAFGGLSSSIVGRVPSDPTSAPLVGSHGPDLRTSANQSDRARLMAQLAAQKAKLKDIEISLETNNLAFAQARQAKKEVYQKQEEFAEVTGKVAKAKQRHGQLAATLASIEPAIKAIEQNRLLRFSQGQPARGSSTPVSPKATTLVLLALLAGIVSGGVFVVLAEVFDHVYRSSGHVARSLGLPMLESIDEIVTGQDRRYLFVRKVVITPLIVFCFIGLTGLTGSMAYLSIERPWAYQKIRKIPQAALHLFAGEPDAKTR